jgi:shikimate kinase
MKYLICGPSGAGKSYILNQCRENIEGDFELYDLDDYIVENHIEDSIKDIIEKEGWDRFRSLEKRCLEALLSLPQDIIIAVGAGALSKENINFVLENAKLLYLKTELSLCWERISKDDRRPLTKLGKDAFIEIHKERENLYRFGREISNFVDLKTILKT